MESFTVSLLYVLVLLHAIATAVFGPALTAAIPAFVPKTQFTAANALIQSAQAVSLLGTQVVITGIRPEIAQTLVNLGVDLSMMQSVGDLQGGIEEAELQLSYAVTRTVEGVRETEA